MKTLITCVAVILWVAIPSAQIARGTVAVAAPVFIRPGAETALKVLAVGTELKVLKEDVGWMQVEFNDAQFGRRVGWVETKLVRTTLEEAARLGMPRVEARVLVDRPLPSPPVRGEQPADAATDTGNALAKLTELLNEAKGKNPHIIVERIVQDIDEVVRRVRVPDWQSSSRGERLVQDELRKVLLKHQLHRDQQLFDRAFACVRQYY